MSKLFEPSSINGMVLSNRFVRSATWEGLATVEGAPTPRLTELMEALARGGVGLIITGHAFVSCEGRVRTSQLGVYSDERTPELARLADAAHAADGKIALQIAHAGIRAMALQGVKEPAGASRVCMESGPAGREMDREELASVSRDFGRAAARAKSAGFDAVQIHAAHGYLLSQFLSPFFNKRMDEYGGAVRNRARLLLEVVTSVREAVGSGYPVLVKMNSQDFLPGGLSVEDMVATAELLELDGVDAVELSGGTFLSGKFSFCRTERAEPGQSEAYYEAAARAYKAKVRVPLMLVGGIRTLETAERLVSEGLTDYIALSRPLVREPYLIERWRSGDVRPAECISDNGCFGPAGEGKGIFCTAERKG